MKVSGFTFIRNALKYDYPVVASITSILPLCDEFIIAVGNSEDATRELIENINSPKIKIIDTTWNDHLRKGGEVLASETNKAFAAVSPDSDWCFYLQADECIHEKYLPVIKDAMLKWKTDRTVEGLLFNYKHFYGSYDFIADSRKWYRREIRIIRNDKGISSYKDAQGFRKNGKKLNVKPIDAFVFHYGWVKPPAVQQTKQKDFSRLWHDEAWIRKNIALKDEFDYSQIDSLSSFSESHPASMIQQIREKNWSFSFNPLIKNRSFKLKILMLIEKYTGWRPWEYSNYKIIP
jgi:hypothetical protein